MGLLMRAQAMLGPESLMDGRSNVGSRLVSSGFVVDYKKKEEALGKVVYVIELGITKLFDAVISLSGERETCASLTGQWNEFAAAFLNGEGYALTNNDKRTLITSMDPPFNARVAIGSLKTSIEEFFGLDVEDDWFNFKCYQPEESDANKIEAMAEEIAFT